MEGIKSMDQVIFKVSNNSFHGSSQNINEFYNNITFKISICKGSDSLYFVLEPVYSDDFKEIFFKCFNIVPEIASADDIKTLINNNRSINTAVFHECEQIKLVNRKIRIDEDYEQDDDDKVYIIKSGNVWELCVRYPVFDHDTTDVESVPIIYCPYCGSQLN